MGKRVGIYALIIIFFVGLGVYLYKHFEKKILQEEEKISLVLKPEEKRKAIIDFRKNTLTTVTKNKKDATIKFKPGLRKAVITEFNDAHVEVWSPTTGFIIEPGLTVFYSDHFAHIGLDVQWFYFRQFGLSSGFGASITNDRVQADLYPVAVNFNLPFDWMPNTNIFLGMGINKNIVAGTSVKF